MPSVTTERGGRFLSSPVGPIFTPERFDSTSRLMIEAAIDFVRQEILPQADALQNLESGLMPRLVHQAGELGFCGVDVPEEYGGLGLGMTLICRLLEFLSQDASFGVTLGVTTGVGAFGVRYYGRADQRAAVLPQLASGEWLASFCLSEPNSGSDALSLTTSAIPFAGGVRLSGTKMWITNARWARVFTVFARGPEGIDAYLLERDLPGLEIAREEKKMGLKGSSTARVVLDRVEVPTTARLHLPGKGHHIALNALNVGRLKLGAMSLGAARRAIEIASIYGQERRQFGKPLVELPLVRIKLARMAAAYFVAESAVYRTAANVEAAFAGIGEDPGEIGPAAAEFAVECSLCKILCTEVQNRIVDEALQIFGGYGFSEEFEISRLYRDVRVSRIYEGANEVNRLFAADRYLRAHHEADAPPEPPDGPVARAAARALKRPPTDDLGRAALAELLLHTLAEASARARAQQTSNPTHEAALSLWNTDATSVWQLALAQLGYAHEPQRLGISVEAIETLASAVIQRPGPLA